MKTLIKNQHQKNQRPNSKHNQAKPKGKVSAATAAQLDAAPEQLSGYDSYYKQLSEEVETVERHVRELRQIPGLEDLTEDEAQEQIDFMLRFSAWVFNQHVTEEVIATIGDVDPISIKLSKVQKPKARSNKK